MAEAEKTPNLVVEGKAETPLHKFTHQAMNAPFQVMIPGGDAEYARQASQAAFEELDRLEMELTKFDPASDVSRIGRLKAGQYAQVGQATIDCLKVAAQVSADTGGAFDVTVGSLMAVWRNPDRSPRVPTEAELAAARAHTGMRQIDIREADFQVGVKADGVKVDLGGIGKGYAVDRMVALLREWGFKSMLVHGGGSSVMAVGTPPGQKGWVLSMGAQAGFADLLGAVCLVDRSMSASASPAGDRHIIDARTGKPALANLAAWVAAGNATLTDALSTAFYVLSPDEVKAYCERHADVSAVVVTEEGGKKKVHRFGKWDEVPAKVG